MAAVSEIVKMLAKLSLIDENRLVGDAGDAAAAAAFEHGNANIGLGAGGVEQGRGDEGFDEECGVGELWIRLHSEMVDVAEIRDRHLEMTFCVNVAMVTLDTTEGWRHLCYRCFFLYSLRPLVRGKYLHASSHTRATFREIERMYSCAACSIPLHQIHLMDMCTTCNNFEEKYHRF